MNEYWVGLSDQASTDITEIYEYISDNLDSTYNASIWLDRMQRAIERLSYVYVAGHRLDINGLVPYYVYNYNGYVIVYIVDNANCKVVVQRVFSANRDYYHLLERG